MNMHIFVYIFLADSFPKLLFNTGYTMRGASSCVTKGEQGIEGSLLRSARLIPSIDPGRLERKARQCHIT